MFASVYACLICQSNFLFEQLRWVLHFHNHIDTWDDDTTTRFSSSESVSIAAGLVSTQGQRMPCLLLEGHLEDASWGLAAFPRLRCFTKFRSARTGEFVTSSTLDRLAPRCCKPNFSRIRRVVFNLTSIAAMASLPRSVKSSSSYSSRSENSSCVESSSTSNSLSLDGSRSASSSSETSSARSNFTLLKCKVGERALGSP